MMNCNSEQLEITHFKKRTEVKWWNPDIEVIILQFTSQAYTAQEKNRLNPWPDREKILKSLKSKIEAEV